jgi:hypothetical protein
LFTELYKIKQHISCCWLSNLLYPSILLLHESVLRRIRITTFFERQTPIQYRFFHLSRDESLNSIIPEPWKTVKHEWFEALQSSTKPKYRGSLDSTVVKQYVEFVTASSSLLLPEPAQNQDRMGLWKVTYWFDGQVIPDAYRWRITGRRIVQGS